MLVVPVCAKIEAEITQLEESARPEFLSLYGLKESQLNRIIRVRLLRSSKLH